MQINVDVSRDDYPAVGGYVEWNFNPGPWVYILVYVGWYVLRIGIERSRT